MSKKPNKPIKNLILIMIVVVAVGILISTYYYRSANAAIDPRIKKARELYSKYNTYASVGDYYKLFALLDSIEEIYESTPHYSNSYELGVVLNNRAAALLTIALNADSIHPAKNPYNRLANDSILYIAEQTINQSIIQYSGCLEAYKNKSEDEIKNDIKDGFSEIQLCNSDKPDYISARVEEIKKSLAETDRRLSVCYTNLGVINRTKGDYKGAILCYERALKLWGMNLDAQNNLNKLLGRPIKKRSLINKLFPPDKDKK